MNKISYSTKVLSPINEIWAAHHGDSWTVGHINTIDANNPTNTGISIPPLKTEDWNILSNWLSTYQTDSVWTLNQLVEMYEKTNPKIIWLVEG